MAEARIESAEEKKKETSLDPDQVKEYCERLFEFRTITIKKFKSWKEKRRHLNEMKRQSRPALPSTTKLITCPIPAEKQDTRSSQKRKEFVLNPIGKSYLCILHEYTQHVLKVQPQYIFKELENAQTPYSATVVINNVEYGIGEGSSKKMAKLEAAKNTLKILLPVLIKVKEQQEEKQQDEDLSFFDEIKIEDPRVAELCNKAALPSPYQILLECLKRNCGMGDTSVQIDKKMLNNQKSEFTMKVGKHTASVTCRNKREGKQRVAQAMLRLLHPHISNWGSLLRLYGDSSTRGFKERKQIPEIQATTSSKTNNQVLENLKTQMRKLQMQKDAIKSKGKLRLENTAIPGSLAQIDLS
ncbi:hypothetical protein CHS0354_029559 [Potamilus streckersoni]|uniref:DRBM domain-containing protein n=1 Tax=Potamilus streckersoni TaxID=2493646 RepID=A0AAE0RUM0_9BIVA|nr:hypothetical protein CHS0354_029559 [Potamilus streckersoni]